MKTRSESSELRILRSLNARMTLAPKEKSYYSTLEKGYDGERKFDERVEPISESRLVLNDLLLECNNTFFQIDSLIITSNTIYLFEVKNYEGDFFIEGDRWCSLPKSEIKNPLLQLQRTESLFRRLLQEHGFNLPIESYLIFINPEFHLYQAPVNLPIIFPTQLNRYIDKLGKKSSTIKETHSRIAEKLLSLHICESPYQRIPDYHFESLQKGIICLHCQTFYTTFTKATLICSGCGGKEKYPSAVLRNVEEFKLLFPDMKITTSLIYEWCGIESKKIIRKILIREFKLVRQGKGSYFIENH